MLFGEDLLSPKDGSFNINDIWKIYGEKIHGEIVKKSIFLREKVKFDAPNITDLGAVHVEGENSQILEVDNKMLVLINRHSVFYNGVRVDVVNVVYEFIDNCF